MRISNQHGRAVVVTADGRAVDVEKASKGAFGPDPMSLFEQWQAFTDWASAADLGAAETTELDPAAVEAVVPRPPQVFAIGLNYVDHAEESGFDIPKKPVVFTKYVSSLTGPRGEIEMSSDHVDWEVELVAVIGKEAHKVSKEDAWEHIAGVTVGQDVSDRIIQFEAPPAQFGMGKSLPGYSPIGPVVVTLDEIEDKDDVEIGCSINGEVMQQGSTSNMVFSVPELVERLSAQVVLLPGDIIFTGTPAGVGVGHKPEIFLKDGDELVTWAKGVGEMTHRFVAPKG